MTINEKEALLTYLEAKLLGVYTKIEFHVHAPGNHMLHEEIYNLLSDLDDSILCDQNTNKSP